MKNFQVTTTLTNGGFLPPVSFGLGEGAEPEQQAHNVHCIK